MPSDNIPRAALAACENALLKGNYDKFLQQARLVGTPLKEEWNSQFAKNSEKNVWHNAIVDYFQNILQFR